MIRPLAQSISGAEEVSAAYGNGLGKDEASDKPAPRSVGFDRVWGHLRLRGFKVTGATSCAEVENVRGAQNTEARDAQGLLNRKGGVRASGGEKNPAQGNDENEGEHEHE